MRSVSSLLSAAAIIGLAAASPAPQQLDLAAILTAAPATASGPALTAITQLISVNTAAQAASISAAVTEIATASITGAAASNAANLAPTATAGSLKRDLEVLEKRTYLTWNQILALLGAYSNAKKTTTSAASTPTAAVKIAASTSASASTSFFTSMQLTSTTSVTTIPGTTTTSSSSTACPTTPEDGTYCGFINPEDPCAPQPTGSGQTITSPDSVDAFVNNAPFQAIASSAATPSGYAQVFSNLNASTSANSYIGLYTLPSYSPAMCAAYCDNTTSCTSFNIYIERDPSQNPTANDSTAPTVWGYWCPNPSSITNYKCTLWGSNIDNTTATNAGGWREQFQVVIVGSNGYDKTNATTPAVVSSYSPPQNCSGKAINGGSYFMDSKFFAGAFDPRQCAAFANATTNYNRQAALNASQHSYTPCQMFNAYHVYKNGMPQGTYCSLYDTQLSTQWATTKQSYSGRDCYSVRNSWTYSLTNADSGRC